ncbi:hypothetical protein BpHYR1_027252 [Brachionus plicatilis]|uniref:Uncharacterized protein n=1 Tax=Brachionus plicatilis TaxID=10195 RepID=A0A3M7P696_BRAPC|nr:hypothetical protein BpHYR1_027252 [Brachionus plicatilis]
MKSKFFSQKAHFSKLMNLNQIVGIFDKKFLHDFFVFPVYSRFFSQNCVIIISDLLFKKCHAKPNRKTLSRFYLFLMEKTPPILTHWKNNINKVKLQLKIAIDHDKC